MRQEASDHFNYNSAFEAQTLSSGSLYQFLSAGDLGENQTLLATDIGASILVFEKHTRGSSPLRCIKSHKFEKLQITDFHRTIKNFELLQQKDHYHIVIDGKFIE